MVQKQIQKISPLSPMQQGMLFHSLLDGDSNAYFEQLTLTLEGEVSKEALEDSFKVLIDRHEILRTLFIHEGMEEMVQVVVDRFEFHVHYVDLSDLDVLDCEQRVNAYLESDRERGFEVSKELLMRVALFQTGPRKYQIVWSHHHLIMDGWSFGILLHELLQIYMAKRQGRKPSLTPVYPFSDFVGWLQEQDLGQALHYWKQYVEGYDKIASFPKKKTAVDSQVYAKSDLSIEIPADILQKLETIAKTNHVTLNTLLQSVWALLLQKYNHTDDVIFGSVVSGRNAKISGIEQIVGMFINTIPVRAKRRKEERFLEWVRRFQQAEVESKEYDYVPLYEIQAGSELKNRLLDHILVFENYPLPEEIHAFAGSGELGFTFTRIDHFDQTNYDLNVTFMPMHGLKLVFSYNSNVYDPELIEQISRSFANMLADIAARPDVSVGEIGLLSAEEKDRMLLELCSHAVPFPEDKLIYELIEDQAARKPDHIALVYGQDRLTYAELNGRANVFARKLLEGGVRADEPVAVLLDRGLEMVVAVLGIWKAGAAYVPIDASYPAERQQLLLQDCGAAWLVTSRELAASGPVLQHEHVLFTDEARGMSTANPEQRIAGIENLAYIIYTSGTTGTPKGVQVTHRSLLNAVHAWRQEYRLDQFPVSLLQMASFSFDVFAGDLARALPNGGTMVICPSDVRLDPEALADLIEEHNITLLESTPALLVPLMDYVYEEKRELISLQLLILGSDVCAVRDFQRLQERFGGRMRVVNSYGVTEACIDSCYYEADDRADWSALSNLPVGRPLPNMRMYVLDEHRNLVPAGVIGEVYIGGAGVAKGYVNRPDLTAERFVPNPFASGETLYRTGDLGRWLADGNLEFIGRTDFQVKIRGYRIEIGEIESVMLTCDGVKEAVVAARKDEYGMAYLCGYYTGDQAATDQSVLDELQARLPSFMVPAVLTKLEKLPLTSNGKVDRKGLPDIRPSGITGAYVEPRSDVEEQLAQIWMETLGIKKVGVYDDFFAIGGHSLTATAIIGKIHKRLQVKVPVPVFFACSTIDKLAQWMVSEGGLSPYETIPQAAHQDVYPLSSAQKRMFFLNQLEARQPVYNMTGAFRLTGNVNVQRLEWVWNQLVKRHESLRTSFGWENGVPVQRIHEHPMLAVTVEKVSPETVDAWCADFVQPFQLSECPLLRVGIAHWGAVQYAMVVDIHHIIADGVSLDLLIEELMSLYQGEPLAEQTLQYKDFAVWQQSRSGAKSYQKHEAYWLDVFQGELPTLDLPLDHQRSSVPTFEGGLLTTSVEPALIKKLHRISREASSTLYATLLSAYAALLHHYTGQNDIVIGSPVAGRSHPDLRSMVGMFVNTLPIRCDIKREERFQELLVRVRDTLLHAYEHQDYPLEELVAKLNLIRDPSRNPLFDTVFVLQNTENTVLRLEDVTIEPYELGRVWAKFDLTIEAIETGDSLLLNFEYNAGLFHEDTVQRLAEQYVRILQQIAELPETTIRHLTLLSAEEKELLTVGYAYVEHEGAMSRADATVAQLFEMQVERRPEGTALVYGDRSMTYGELNAAANRLAAGLRELGVGPDQTVAVMTDPSPEMFVGMLAVLKAGGAFIPIDPAYPEQRIQYILQQSGTRICLTQAHLSLPEAQIERIDMKVECASDLNADADVDVDLDLNATGGCVNLPPCNTADDAAYVIYTSGSTGAPKGVVIEHRSLINLCDWHIAEYEVTERDRAAKYAAFGFDASVWEVFPYLLCGASIVVIDPEIRLDLVKLQRYFQEQQITIAFLPTHVCEQFMDYPVDSLRILLTGGDRLKIWKKTPYRIYNNYGPTENTVVTTFCLIDREYDQIPIGKPLYNTRLYVLNADLQMVPIGAVGELCISGVGLARGYLNSPELTQEKFIDNPYISGERLYRTGDLVRIAADGNLVFMSRADHQVKIRGYRIELGEIEAALAKQPLIREAVVIDVEDSRKQRHLAAYVLADTSIDTEEVKAALSQSLPSYMVPSVIVQLDAIPLTPNGKVDRKSLPQPTLRDRSEESFAAPESPMEQELAQIWEEVLGLEQPVSIHDDFFAIGGNSIQSIQVVNRLYQRGYQLDMKHFFQYPSIAEMSRYVTQAEAGAAAVSTGVEGGASNAAESDKALSEVAADSEVSTEDLDEILKIFK
ncbi:non-ribosomal peptide synthetase [Paenibacillus turpanensis]|uniref:non-ribosomal peptide synthetase n=1 Tax=Paenibacillus turpanensis TaxID=2689078 RepID=UPI00140B09D5|nr:non-ribosomal peptide synthetase [Paenibacillus turpanensis]